MAKAYSTDLRERAVKQFKKGMAVITICATFCISQKSLYRWIKLDKKYGNVEPKKQTFRGGSEPKLKPYEYEKFKYFLIANMGLNSIQLAEKWGNGMTPKTMRMWMKRLGFTIKKNNLPTLKQIQ